MAPTLRAGVIPARGRRRPPSATHPPTFSHNMYRVLLLVVVFHSLQNGPDRFASSDEPSYAELPKLKPLPGGLKAFDYDVVGPKIPDYAAGTGATMTRMQLPAPATESIKHIATPRGMHVQLFADESMLGGSIFQGKPIAMNWDSKGRLWICETLDYPNQWKPPGQGRDRIRILEDVDGDGVADRSTVFADRLSIPTAITFHRGGAVVQNGVETVYLKDTDGDGKADVRKVLISNWTLGDTHGGVSNFRYGLDNWIWAMQGYNSSSPEIGQTKLPAFRMGFFRFKLTQEDPPNVEALEFIRSTTNNTWGLGMSEEGLIFGSTANRQPSFFMPIPNRYYERVKGWAPETLQMICPTHRFDPISDNVRQVDHHGGYTAAAGHALYTARNYPRAYWNRTAFVCGPTGKLVGTFVIERDGAGMKSKAKTNLLASDDEWTAPIMAEVGPDGNVWVLDWYNYIVQHNPTPQGFQTGKGRAYVTDLRDRKHGRIYRVVTDESKEVDAKPLSEDLTRLPNAELVNMLRSPTMLVRLHAQRLLVESGSTDVVDDLVALVDDRKVDSIGLNVAAIHALNVLHGIGALDSGQGRAVDAATRALSHDSGGVRMNAVRVLPNNEQTINAISRKRLLSDEDPQVILASLLKISDIRTSNAGGVLARAAATSTVNNDPWLRDALVSAGAMHAAGFLHALLREGSKLGPGSQAAVERVSEHFARLLMDHDQTAKLFEDMSSSTGNANDSIVIGLGKGWPKNHQIRLRDDLHPALRKLFDAASPQAKGMLASLAQSMSISILDDSFNKLIVEIASTVRDDQRSVDDRVSAAHRWIDLAPQRQASVDALARLIGPQSPVKLSTGLISAIGKSRSAGLSQRLTEIAIGGTPTIRDAVMQRMLSRADLTDALLTAIEERRLQFSDLSASQRSALRNHPIRDVRRRTRLLVSDTGLTRTSTRQQLVHAKLPLASRTGDVTRGKAIFKKHCAACHVFQGEGNVVGPNLNGMSVHPKSELLMHILDPNRSVEANYRLYNVLTTDGTVVSGLLSGETLTSIEMVDARGQRHLILREDIDQLLASKKSAMPEGLEQTINDDALADLLEYMTQVGEFIPLGLERVFNSFATDKQYLDPSSTGIAPESVGHGLSKINDVPFALVDDQNRSVRNAIRLSPTVLPKLRGVSVRCKIAANRIHLFGGSVGSSESESKFLVVRLHFEDDSTEDYPLPAGPIRHHWFTPNRQSIIDTIELVKPDDESDSLILAVTVQPHRDEEQNPPPPILPSPDDTTESAGESRR